MYETWNHGFKCSYTSILHFQVYQSLERDNISISIVTSMRFIFHVHHFNSVIWFICAVVLWCYFNAIKNNMSWLCVTQTQLNQSIKFESKLRYRKSITLQYLFDDVKVLVWIDAPRETQMQILMHTAHRVCLLLWSMVSWNDGKNTTKCPMAIQFPGNFNAF